MTKRDEGAFGSQLKRIMAHLLKQRYQPERATPSWAGPIPERSRAQIADILDQSPSLRRLLPDLMTKNYPRAIAQASDDTGLSNDTFPDQPPFTLAQVLGEEP